VDATVVAPGTSAANTAEVANARLDHRCIGRDPVKGTVVQADAHVTVEDGDGGRHGAGLAYRCLDLACHCGAGFAGPSVTDDRGLEGDDRAALTNSGADLLGNDHDELSTITMNTLRMPQKVAPMSIMVYVAGDVMLDVLVLTQRPLRADDDMPAAITLSTGGQGANVAAWVCDLGGRARLYGPRTCDAAGKVIDPALSARGVHLHAEPGDTHCGAVVSWFASRKRTLASDPGDLGWIDQLMADSSWSAGADRPYLSGYLLLRAPDPAVVIGAAHVARQVGARVAVNLASAAMIETHGPKSFRDLIASIAPTVVLGNEGQWDVLGGAGLARCWSMPLSSVAGSGLLSLLVVCRRLSLLVVCRRHLGRSPARWWTSRAPATLWRPIFGRRPAGGSGGGSPRLGDGCTAAVLMASRC
jgi:ribokinase